MQVAVDEVKDVLTVNAEHAAGAGAVAIFPVGRHGGDNRLRWARADEVGAAESPKQVPPVA